MTRRFLLIAFVFAITLFLMVIKNGVLTGTQELFASIADYDNDRLELRFADLGGNFIDATDAEKEAVVERLKGDPTKDESEIPFKPESAQIQSDGRIVLEVLSSEQTPITLADLRARLTTEAYRRPNPSLPFWHTVVGIDLRGGVEFRLALFDDNGVRVNADDQTVAILRDRLDARGLSEPQVSRLSNGDVQVIIPGGTEADAARTRKVLQTAGRLEFREVMKVYGRGGQGADAALYSSLPEPGNRVQEVKPGVFELVDDEFINFNDVLYPAKPAYRGAKPTVFYRLGPAKLTGQDVSAAFGTTHEGQLAVGITFSAAGGAKNFEFTRGVKQNGPSEGGPGTGLIGISLDGLIESAPTIISPSGKHSVISGQFSQEEIDQLSTVLKAGSLQVTPSVLAERVVGPSLGAETVAKGLGSMIVAMILILGIMLTYYRRLGVVACLSLVSTVLLIYGVLVVFGATLTLPGIAGLVLTVGMAVDANILIFERIREEMREDMDLPTSIEAGYGRALSTIVDANLTTFLTALILYWQGSGPIQGFGLTLMIGIATSMFSAIYVGRTLTNLLYKGKQQTKITDLIGEVRLPYVKWRWIGFTISAIVMTLGMLEFFVFTKPNRNFDIDFTGGNMVQVTFNKAQGLDDIMAGLEKASAAGVEQLNPDDVQIQPYYADFASGGGPSFQWTFKTRDEDAVVIETKKAELDLQRAQLMREADGLRALEQPELAKARTKQSEAEKLQPEIDELNEQISSRIDIIAQKLREVAYPGLIDEPGTEITHVSVQGRVIDIRLKLLDPITDTQLSAIADRVKANAAIVEASAEKHGEGELLVIATYGADIGTVLEFDYDDAAAVRVRDLVVGQYKAAAEADEAVNFEAPAADGAAVAAYELYAATADASARSGVRVAKPFPSSEHFSGTVATQMKIDASIALAVALLGILAYVAARFEFRYGVGAVIALFHDVPITLGLLALFGLRIDLTVVAGLLTIIGYSLNDTIVVFDRIRENRQLNPDWDMAKSIDRSIAQTMSRTLLTSLTTIGVVMILFFFGGDGIRAFAGTMIIGLILGTYSSVFIAAPVLLLLDRKGKGGTPAVVEGEVVQEGPEDGEARTPDVVPSPA